MIGRMKDNGVMLKAPVIAVRSPNCFAGKEGKGRIKSKIPRQRKLREKNRFDNTHNEANFHGKMNRC